MKESSKGWNIAYYFVNLVFLFLLSVHFGGYAEKIVIIWAVLMIGVALALHQGLEIDKVFWVLAIAMVWHGWIFGQQPIHQSDYWKIRFHFSAAVFPPLLMYLMSQQMVWKRKQEQIEILILSICIGTFIYSILNYSVYLQEGFLPEGRVWNEFWTHTSRYATEFSYWGVFIAGLVGYAFSCFTERKWLRGITVCILIIVENAIQIIVDNRMVIMITVVAMALSMLLYIYFNRRNRKKLMLLFLTFLFAIIIIFAIVAANVGGIRDTAYYNHFFTRDGGIIRNVRFQMIWEAILQIPSHWKGGGTMVAAGIPVIHNYWLQVANDTGIFPFGLWMIFNIAFIISLIKCVKNPRISIRMKYMIVPLACAVISYLSMEMGGHGQSEYILFYVVLVAIVRQLERNERIEEI